MTAARIDLLVLDGQGVVFSDPLQTFLTTLAESTGQSAARVRALWNEDLRERAWRGTIDDDELWRTLTRSDGTGWGARFEAEYVAGPAAPRLPGWSARLPIWLLTNHRTPWIEARLDRLGLRPWLSRILVSDALGALKPERAVFEPLLAWGSDPARVLVVDDQPKNVRAAAALGFSALLADPAGTWVGEVDRRVQAGSRMPAER